MTDEFMYTCSETGLAGWIRKDLQGDHFGNFFRDPERFLKDPSSQILKNGQKVQVIRRTLNTDKGKVHNVIIKRFCYPSVFRRLMYFLIPSPASRCLKGASVLESNGIPTAVPLAALEHRNWKDLGISYYVAEEIADSHPLSVFWGDVLPTLSMNRSVKERRKILGEVAGLFHKLHSRGIYHQDLKGSNILVQAEGSDHYRCTLVDVEGVTKRNRLSWRKRVKNLVQLNRTLGKRLNLTDKAFFLKYYADLFSLSRQERKTLAQRVLSLSRKEDLRSLRKRAKRNLVRAAL